MRLDSLRLLRFGPFSDVTLDLSAGSEGLHVVFGRNEAGKSSTLRALRSLLYGIPTRTPDNFVHAYDQLRIGGNLQRRDGDMLEIIRRKASRNTLRAADDQAIIGDEVLDRFLGGVDQDAFTAMFGIDHKSLVAGGHAIAGGKGRVGELLFAAGAGLVELHRLQEQLKQEMADLFKPRGQEPRINQHLRQLRDAREDAKSAQLSVDEWNRHDSALRTAEASLEQLTEALKAKQAQHARLARILRALPAIARWRQKKHDLQPYLAAPLLPADFKEQRISASTALDTARQQKHDANRRLEQLADEMQALQVPQDLLAAAGHIEHLRERLGSHRKAMHDRPAIELSRATAQAAAVEILKSLGSARNLEQAESLRLPRDQVVRIQNLANRQTGLAQALESALAQCARARRKLQRIEDELADAAAVVDAAPLRSAVNRVQAEGSLERQQAALLAEIRQFEDDAAVRLAQLSFSGGLEQLERLHVPSEETISRFDEQMAERARQLANLRQREAELAQSLATCVEELAELDIARDVPDPESLERARQRREQGWALVLDQWRQGGKRTAEAQQFVNQTPGAADLAQAYERSVEAADAIADRLRTLADAVAKKASLQREHARATVDLQTLGADLRQALAAEQELTNQWAQCWTAVGVEARTPKEMIAWLRRQQAAVQLAGQLRAKRLAAAELHERIESARAELAKQLASLEDKSALAEQSLAELLGRSQDRLVELQARQSRRDELVRDRAQAAIELAEMEAQSRICEDRLAEWNRDWAKAMKELHLAGDATPSQANAVLDSNTRLFQHLEQMEKEGLRITGIDRDAQAFLRDVEEAARRLAPELVGGPVEAIVEGHCALLTTARSAQTRLVELERRREEQVKRRAGAEQLIEKSEATLKALCREAGCQAAAELPEAERRSFERREISDAIQLIEEDLLSHSGGQPLAEFIEQSKDEIANADCLPAQLETLTSQIEQLHAERESVLTSIGSERTELARMTGSSDAAAMAEEQESLIAALDEDVHQLAVLRLAAGVLRAAIERYRQQNQDPILDRASRLFATLTCGSFVRLLTDFDDDGQPILVGQRSDGANVLVAGMSDGTADQLYLALRLASLEHWFKVHEPIPFIVDDVLLNFDNDRAAAALRCLADLSDHVQVILFTHHEHLVDLAKEQVAGGRLFLHELPRAENAAVDVPAHEFVG